MSTRCIPGLLAAALLIPNLAAGEVRYNYDAAGRLTRVDYGGGVVLTFVYDAAGNLTRRLTSSPTGFTFPYYQAQGDVYTGFAVSNPSDRTASLTFTALGEGGQLLPFAANPAILALAPGRQSARLGHEIFGTDSSTIQRGWVKTGTNNDAVAGFFLAGSGLQLDGSSAFTRQARKLYFTRAVEGPASFRGQPAATFLSIVNPNDHAITLRLRLWGPVAGQLLAPVRTEILPPHGLLMQTLSQLFVSSAPISRGYVEAEVTEGAGAVGFQLIRLDGRDTVIGLNASFGNPGNDVYSAQLANGDQGGGLLIFTDLKLMNTATETRALTIRAVSENGSRLGVTVQRTLLPGEILEEDAGRLFGLGPETTSPVTVGSIRVETDGPGVIGDVIFGDPVTFRYAAALPAQTHTFTRAVFSQVANALGFFTGVALFNPGTGPASVTLEVYSEEGALSGWALLTLEGGRRLSRLLTELVPQSAGQLRGYIVVRSTLPLIGQVVFADSDLNFLAAVPPAMSP